MLVKACRALVFRIHNNREYRWVGARPAKHGVHDKGFADPSPLKNRRDGEAPNQTGWNQRVPRQFLDLLAWQVAKRNTRSGEGVVAGNFAPLSNSDETIADTPLDVLRRKFPEVAVKRLNAARKRSAVMLRAERFNLDRIRQA
jgi:hypothetical protein